jgi:hypothetical protein
MARLPVVAQEAARGVDVGDGEDEGESVGVDEQAAGPRRATATSTTAALRTVTLRRDDGTT